MVLVEVAVFMHMIHRLLAVVLLLLWLPSAQSSLASYTSPGGLPHTSVGQPQPLAVG